MLGLGACFPAGLVEGQAGPRCSFARGVLHSPRVRKTRIVCWSRVSLQGQWTGTSGSSCRWCRPGVALGWRGSSSVVQIYSTRVRDHCLRFKAEGGSSLVFGVGVVPRCGFASGALHSPRAPQHEARVHVACQPTRAVDREYQNRLAVVEPRRTTSKSHEHTMEPHSPPLSPTRAIDMASTALLEWSTRCRPHCGSWAVGSGMTAALGRSNRDRPHC